ncbi:hypothetical protein [Tianweitania sediminis]|uniref:Uncharacterized protein n=1 Tax=Tianweitania sediminis TaxID=1502156 RepID=A0A8J7R3Q3_9HYPH|nr:hypothetical protein [Tianweitania sediminis]MBP0441365.1 hypothetical protein [Tianweitania sediminis]
MSGCFSPKPSAGSVEDQSDARVDRAFRSRSLDQRNELRIDAAVVRNRPNGHGRRVGLTIHEGEARAQD